MSKFAFDPAIPPLVRDELARKLAALEWLIPGWCQRVKVFWEKDGERDDH